MNDPWSVLIDTLNGAERQTPARWDERRVHRMADQAPRIPRKPRPVRRLDASARRAAPISRLRCACAECTPVSVPFALAA